MGNIIFYAPHADDESLTMGIAILNHVYYGHNVHVVLMTNGEGSKVVNELNGSAYCDWHSRYHDPAGEGFNKGTLTDQEFGEIRTEEFRRACRVMMLPDSNIHNFVYPDGGLTVENAKSIMRSFEDQFPGAAHKTISWRDNHPDHSNAGIALRELYDAGEVNDARFYLKRNQWETYPGSKETFKEEYRAFIEAVIQSYKLYHPSKGFYGIGYHSVPTSFDALLANPESRFHRVDQYR